MTFAERAQLVTSYGIPVMPLRPRTKIAFLDGWENLATTDDAQIEKWDAEYPAYNCAAVARFDGFWFWDVDAVAVLEQMEKDTGHTLDELDTLIVKSSGEKRHFYFKHDDCSRVMANRDCDIDGKEAFSVRANNRYVVAAGSIHPDTGKRYETVHEPIFGEIPVAPQWLTDWITRCAFRQQAPASHSAEVPTVIPKGGRDNWLFAQACTLRDDRYPQETVLTKLRGLNKERCNPPMSDSTVKRKVESAFTREPRGKAETIAKVLEGKSSATAQELEFHLPAAEVTTCEDYDFVVDPLPSENPNEKYDGWFPLGSPSLVGGLSGSSKTTWMVQLLQTQLYKQEFFGHTTKGRPFLIVMADRGAASHRRTMHRMRFDPDFIPIKFISVKTGLAALQEIVNTIEATSPIPQVVFIEGLDMLVDDANKKSVVSPFMAALQKIAERYHIAIVGSVGAPKTKAGEGYVAKRDNISGTEAWSRLSETVVLLQYPNGKDTAIERELSVLPRNAASESFALVFDRGRLRLQTEEDHKRLRINEDGKLRWVQEQAKLAAHDPKKRWWTVLDMMRGLKQPNGKDMPKTTAHRWVQDACTKGFVVEKPGRRGHNTAAEFRWNESKLNPLWSGTLEDTEHSGEQEEMAV